MQKQIKLERSYPHAITQVWDAISTGENMTKWFLEADFQPEVGYKYTFAHDGTKIVGEVKEVSEPNKLVYTWMVEGTNLDSTVIWTLNGDENKTNVVIEHTSHDEADSNPMIAQMFMEFEKGWENVYEQLAKYLG